MGAQTVWAVQSVEGLDLPKVRSGDADRPFDSGEFEGLDFLAGRDITFTMHSQPGAWQQLRPALSALTAVMQPPSDGVTESPLWFVRPGLEQMAVMVRPRRFGLKSDNRLVYAHTAQPVLQFHATSAYLFGPTQSATVGVEAPGGGFGFPIVFPLSFGTAPPSGIINATNNGPAPCRPYIVFTGPITNPSIANTSLVGSPAMSFELDLPAGAQLVVDMDLGSPSALYFLAGTTQGVSRLNDMLVASAPWLIEPGENVLLFTSSDTAPTGGTCNVQWADTWPIGL